MAGDARLAQCPRCKTYTLVDERHGVRLAVDIAPVDAVAYGNAIAVGVELYWVQKRQNGGMGALSRYSGTPRPSWGPGGLQEGIQRLHAEHSCGAPARDMVILNVTPPKNSAPATPGAPKDGSRPKPAPAGATPGQGRPSPAGYATGHLSDDLGGFRPPTRPTRCGICDQMITPGQAWWGFEHSTTVYAEHEECP